MPEFVSINKFKNLTDSKLSREVLKELCKKGVIPHITTEKGYILINLDDAPEAIRQYSLNQAAKAMKRNGGSSKPEKTERGRFAL